MEKTERLMLLSHLNTVDDVTRNAEKLKLAVGTLFDSLFSLINDK